MEPLCEFCGMAMAVVYCKSDMARLCLYCDGCVHSANALSRRHPRFLLCDKCNAQPAIIRCMDEKTSLCQSCDHWSHNNTSINGITTASAGGGMGGHRTHALTCYTGCPSLAEFSRIWSVLEGSSSSGGNFESSNWDQSLGSAVVATNQDQTNYISNNGLEGRDNNDRSFGVVVTAGKLNGGSSLDQSCGRKFDTWIASSSTLIPSNPNCTPHGKDQTPFLPQESSLPKGCTNFKDLAIQDSNVLCDGLNVDDVPLTFENPDGIFCPQVPSRYQFEDRLDREMDCLLMEKSLSVTESNGPNENAAQASSSGQQERAAFQSSCGSDTVMPGMNGSANCLLMNPTCSRSINLGFPTVQQVHPSMSLTLPSIGRESNPDYQDCELSTVFLTGEPWESTLEASSPQARDKAKMRYKEKKKTRTFGKQIRYASRKARADTRKRVKGRFVKAGEEYDYDPLVTTSF
ncbi:putative zinc finger protein CONSTANS-LIKE 11 [Pyrus communis]|uniref:putative zinc finger protein CONSTANS-LIKE 11 n=1 Tax=Pyrus communis TaxID=23211 RepID=UPI0035C24434